MENTKVKNEVELTEQEIVQGAFNVVKKHLIEKLEKEGEETSMLKILGLEGENFREKFNGEFCHSVSFEGSYTNTWKRTLEKCDSIEEVFMALHVIYKTMADIKEMSKDSMTALLKMLKQEKDPAEELLELLKRGRR